MSRSSARISSPSAITSSRATPRACANCACSCRRRRRRRDRANRPTGTASRASRASPCRRRRRHRPRRRPTRRRRSRCPHRRARLADAATKSDSTAAVPSSRLASKAWRASRPASPVGRTPCGGPGAERVADHGRVDARLVDGPASSRERPRAAAGLFERGGRQDRDVERARVLVGDLRAQVVGVAVGDRRARRPGPRRRGRA